MANSILHIRQIKQNFGIQFQCFERDSLLYIGEDAFLNEHLPARLLTPSNEEILRYNADVRGIAQAYIPLNNKSDHTGFLSNSQGNNMGRFYQSGIGRNKYYCTEFQNRIFNIYLFSSVTEKLLIYDEERQIGQVEKSKFTKNNLDTYTMYLLDGYSYFHALFCFSVMLYDKFEHGYQGEFFSGTKNTASIEWTVAGIGKECIIRNLWLKIFRMQ